MKRALSIIPVACALSGCVTTQLAIPDGYAGPVVTVRDSVVEKSTRSAHLFYISQVDDRTIKNSWIAMSRYNAGKGMRQHGVALTHQLPQTTKRLELKAGTMYAAPILLMTNPSCSVVGVVDVKLSVDRSYVVRGSISAEQCAVWLEDFESQQVVSEKITGPGLK